MIKVVVRWNKEIFEDVEVDPDQPAIVLKAQLCSLTGVHPERQKIIGLKGGTLKDDADMKTVGLKQGMTLMMIGTAEGSEIRRNDSREWMTLFSCPLIAAAATVFAEDLTTNDKAKLIKGKKIEPAPMGLVNLGNTCYLNSVMQFLKGSSDFQSAIKEFSNEMITGTGDEKLCGAYKVFQHAAGLSDEALPPLIVVEALRSRYPQFASRDRQGGYAQQDAEECLSALLSSFSVNTPAIDKLFAFEQHTELKCLENPEETPTHQKDRLRLLSCHLGTQLTPVNHLHEGIRLFLDEEMVKMSETLGRNAQYKKMARLNSIPEMLLVHFVRFEWKRASDMSRTDAGRTKMCRRVQFPVLFDIFEFCTPEQQSVLKVGRIISANMLDVRSSSKDAKIEGATGSPPSTQSVASGVYELQSIVTHQGRTADGGHYIGWNKKNDDIWYKFDDEMVSEVRWKDLDLSGGRSNVTQIHKDAIGDGDFHIAVLLMYKLKKFEATEDEVKCAKEQVDKENEIINRKNDVPMTDAKQK